MLRENAREIGDDGESRKRVADFTATIFHIETSNERTQYKQRWILSYRIFDKKFARYFECKRCGDIRERWRNFTSIRCRSELADESSTRRCECNVRNRIAKCTALVNFFKSWLGSRLPYDLSDSYLKLSLFALFIACFTLHPMILYEYTLLSRANHCQLSQTQKETIHNSIIYKFHARLYSWIIDILCKAYF